MYSQTAPHSFVGSRSDLLQMPIQPGIQAAIGDQLLMITILGNPPAVEYQHAVGLFHR
jgi:hypothetical protein